MLKRMIFLSIQVKTFPFLGISLNDPILRISLNKKSVLIKNISLLLKLQVELT